MEYIEPELNAIYSSKYATNYIRGDLDETAYKAGAQVSNQMTKSPYNYFARSKDNSKGNYVAFGFFPQTIKANDVVVEDSWKETFNGVEYYKGSDGYLYEKVKENAYTTSYKYSNEENINQASANSYRYFKLEPIIWQVLTESNGSAFLFSVSALTAKCFYEKNENRTISGNIINANNYEYSYVRAFLNGKATYGTNGTLNAEGYIYNYKDKGLLQKSFTSAQQNLMKENSASFNDKMFLLSYEEMGTTYYSKDADRIKYPTDYAGATRILRGDVATNGCNYWLCSSQWSVLYTGQLSNTNSPNFTTVGVLPAFLLKIQ